MYAQFLTAVGRRTVVATTAVGTLEIAMEVACRALMGSRGRISTLDDTVADRCYPVPAPSGLHLERRLCRARCVCGTERAATVAAATLCALSSSHLGSAVGRDSALC